jgi:hypothetical protein
MHRYLARFRWIAAAALALAGCGSPVPPDKLAYVGEWKSQDMWLNITREGNVQYERRRGGARTTVQAPLQAFEGDNFVVGIGPMKTKFVVSKPPFRDGAVWKMVVDGVELVRRDSGEERQA